MTPIVLDGDEDDSHDVEEDEDEEEVREETPLPASSRRIAAAG